MVAEKRIIRQSTTNWGFFFEGSTCWTDFNQCNIPIVHYIIVDEESFDGCLRGKRLAANDKFKRCGRWRWVFVDMGFVTVVLDRVEDEVVLSCCCLTGIRLLNTCGLRTGLSCARFSCEYRFLVIIIFEINFFLAEFRVVTAGPCCGFSPVFDIVLSSFGLAGDLSIMSVPESVCKSERGMFCEFEKNRRGKDFYKIKSKQNGSAAQKMMFF